MIDERPKDVTELGNKIIYNEEKTICMIVHVAPELHQATPTLPERLMELQYNMIRTTPDMLAKLLCRVSHAEYIDIGVCQPRNLSTGPTGATSIMKIVTPGGMTILVAGCTVEREVKE